MSGRSVWLPRVLLGLGAAALLASVISIAVGEGGPDARPTTEGFNEVQQLFAGLPQEGALVGAEDAPVLVTVYNDLRCIPCADFEIDDVDSVVDTYARNDEVEFEFSHFSLGPEPTSLAALAATAAGEQGRQWQYLDLLFRNLDSAGPEVDDEFLVQIAEAVPELDLDQWEDDRVSDEVREIVDDDAASATALRLRAEPAVIVTGPAGERRLEGSPDAERITAAVEAVS